MSSLASCCPCFLPFLTSFISKTSSPASQVCDLISVEKFPPWLLASCHPRLGRIQPLQLTPLKAMAGFKSTSLLSRTQKGRIPVSERNFGPPLLLVLISCRSNGSYINLWKGVSIPCMLLKSSEVKGGNRAFKCLTSKQYAIVRVCVCVPHTRVHV